MEKFDKFCQSCGMPIEQDPEKGGTNQDGSKSENMYGRKTKVNISTYWKKKLNLKKAVRVYMNSFLMKAWEVIVISYFLAEALLC